MSGITVGKLLFTLPLANQLGEGVQWHHESQSIWWTDIENSVLLRYDVNTQQITQHLMPDRVGSFAFIANDPRLIIAFATGIALYDLTSKNLQWLAQPEKELSNNRFNDGRVDRQGRFWAGTMVENKTVENKAVNKAQPTQLGALYVVRQNKKVHKVMTDIEISNSLCWSLDGLTMYHADSPSRLIYQYDFAPNSGSLANKKVFAKTPLVSVPDGATVDALGGVWSAQWGGGNIIRYTPQGNVSLSLALAVSQPTCVAIGGPDLNWLMVTSAKQGLSMSQLKKEPLAGGVFVYQLHGVKGVTESRYLLNP